MSVFLTQRIRDIQGWLPPTDVDGLEVNRQRMFTEQSENIVYENGFWKNNKKPKVVAYPTNINTQVTAGYTVVGCKFMNHASNSEYGGQGAVWFYMLKNDSNLYKFFVEDANNPSGLELQVMDGLSTIETEVPLELNYFIVDNQLKINTNIVTVGPDGVRSYANLTLVYIENYKRYGSGLVLPTTARRDAGWYLVPRWLGFTYGDVITEVNEDTTNVNFDTSTTDVDNSHGEGYTIGDIDWTNSFWKVGGGAVRFKAVVTEQYWEVDGIDTNKGQRIEFWWNAYSWGSDGSALSSCVLEVRNFSNVVLHTEDLRPTSTSQWVKVSLDLTRFTDPDKVRIICPDHTGVTPVKYPHFDEFNIEYVWAGEWAIGVVNDDKQRAIIQNGGGENSTKGLTTSSTITIDKDLIDWRVITYEFYAENSAGLLVRTLEIAPTDFTDNDPNIEFDLDTLLQDPITGEFSSAFDTSQSTDTINFLYGLGASIRPWKSSYGDLTGIGDYIYNEVTFRGREYYVRDEFRIYMSHIAGNGLLQPDSFPYDGTTQFGFIKTEYEFEVAKSLAITPLEELLVLTSDNNYIYTIQSGQDIIYRRIKAMNGSSGIASRKSLLIDDRGTAIPPMLVWIDKNGAYAHGGGVQSPVDISKPIEHYWITNVNADDIKSIYNPELEEIIFDNGTEQLVYEVGTNMWNRYVYDSPVSQFIGIVDNQCYFLADDGVRYKITEDTDKEFQGTFTTHIDAGYNIGPDGNPAPVNELNDKILQELYVSFRERRAGDVAINIIADGNLIGGTTGGIAFSGSQMVQNSWTPILIRYHHVQIRFTILSPKLEIKEIGYTFSVPSQAPGGLPYRKSGGFGYKSGQEFGL